MSTEAGAAAPAITELLKERNEFFVDEVIDALRKIGSEAKTAIPALTTLLKDKHRGCSVLCCGGRGEHRPRGKGHDSSPYRLAQGQS